MEHPEKRPSQKPHRKRLALLITLCLLALALLFYFVLLPMIQSRYPSKAIPQITVEHTERTLGEREQTKLSELTVTHAWDGESYTLVYQENKLLLQNADGAPSPVSEALTDEILLAATSFIVEDTIAEDMSEVTEHLSDMGLDPAQITVDVVLSDGERYQLAFGIKVPDTTCYYYRWTGCEGVFMADSASYEAFEMTAQMLLPVSQPAFYKSLVDTVTVEIPGQETLTLTYTTDDDGNASAVVTQPTRYIAAQELSDAILTALSSFRLGTYQGELTDENRSSYGLDEPRMTLTVRQNAGMYTQVGETGELETHLQPESTLMLHVGAEAGDYFYYVEYEGGCYYVSRFLLATLLSVTPEKLYTRAPADMGEAEVKSVLIQKGDTVLDVRIARVERVLPNNTLETDENGSVLYDVTATKNGETIPVEAAEQLIERLKALTVSGDVPDGYVLGADAPRWKITLTTEGGQTRTLAAYPIDALTDAVMVDGEIKHSVYNEAILILMSDL